MTTIVSIFQLISICPISVLAKTTETCFIVWKPSSSRKAKIP